MKLFDEVFSDNDVTELNEDLLLEMANLSHQKTGLPYDIWIDSEGVNRKNTHDGPRIKVKVNDQFIPFEISDNPDIPNTVKKTGVTDFLHKNKIREYVIAYKKILLAHYYKQIDDTDALNLLKTIKYASESEKQLEMYTTLWPNLRIEFRWDNDESLYVINVVSDKGVIETVYAMDTSYQSREVTELQLKYKIERTVNLDKTF